MSIVRRKAGKGHYYLIDGKKADGVTTLIKDGLPAPALTRWAAKSVAEYVADNAEHMREVYDWMDRDQLVSMLKQTPWSQRDTAAARGTDVHSLAERLIHHEEVDVPEHLTGYVESCVRFLDEWQVRPVLVETVVASRKWGYCGTLDVVADVCDGRRVILDYKTSNSGIWPETVLQEAAYRHAEVYVDGDEEKPLAEVGIEGALAVWLRADGYDVFDLPCDEAQYNAFLYVRTVALWARKAKELIGEPCEVPKPLEIPA